MNIQNNSRRAEHIIKIFWGLILISLLASISGYFEIELIKDIQQDNFVSDEEIESNDLRQSIIAVIQTILLVLTWIFFLNWFRRAYANLSRAGVEANDSDSWTIWGFIVPIMSLYKPYKMMKELVDKMYERIKQNSLNYYDEKPTFILGIWWTLFLISGILGQIAWRMFGWDPSTMEDLLSSSQFTLASDLFDIAAAWVTIVMIKRVSSLEVEFEKYSENEGMLDQFGQADEDINTED